MDLNHYTEAAMYFDSAYHVAAATNDINEMANGLVYKGYLSERMGNQEKAIDFLEQAKAKGLELDSTNSTVLDASKALVTLYEKQGNLAKALYNHRLHIRVRDSIHSIEGNQRFNSMLFDSEMQKKQGEIALLAKDQELQKKEVVRQKEIRNAIGIGFCFLGIFAVTVVLQRNRIGKEKARSEELLLNILPHEVAEELKAKGEAEARQMAEATVLFTDFKGFTQLSETLTPKELVRDLHECFTAFDNICQRHGIEKIKTIGDAYMAASGLPTPCPDHAQRAVRVALEMVAFVEQGKAHKQAEGLPFFEVRIGIHTGPVVAGIVGVKKFSYDIWGDTVNTASRMESSGVAGRVNISDATYQLVKDHFTCEYRGEIEAKGKGRWGCGLWALEVRADTNSSFADTNYQSVTNIQIDPARTGTHGQA